MINQVSQRFLAVSSIVISAGLSTPDLASADVADLVQQIDEDPAVGVMSQVTSVSQLEDVEPTAWAFQALQSLVERYGCVIGYPDRTYRGNRAMTRYEFAAGLNACMDRIKDLIAATNADLVTKEDLAVLQKLQDEFANELAVLRGRVDGLEAKVGTLEKQAFSTTTKLVGETIFSIAAPFSEEKAGGGDSPNTVTMGYRSRLNFVTSFMGKDELRVRLQGQNIVPLDFKITGTNMTRISYDGNSNNLVGIDDFFYRFPIGNQTQAWLIANGYGTEAMANPFNPFLRLDGTGSISRFGRFSPIYRLVTGPGIGIEHKFSDKLALVGVYRARGANAPATGLFNGNSSALAQLSFTPTKNVEVGLTYAYSYFPATTVDASGSTGSQNAQRPFDKSATLTHSYSAVASYRISPQLNLSGWVGFTDATAKSGATKGAEANIWNWAVALALPDLGIKGNLGAILVGVPPKVTSNTIANRRDPDTSLHLEVLYRHQVNDRISITPGLLVIFNPEHNQANPTQYVGVLRTTFSF